MLVETPEIHYHGTSLGTPIQTVDVQSGSVAPGTYRIATGGDEIRIWFVKKGSRNADQRPNIDFRSSLTRHEGPVNVLRFSPQGKLASADTLGHIFVWERVQDDEVERERERIARDMIEREHKAKKIVNRKTSLEQDVDVVDIETWTSGKAYKSHLRDVTDIAWSPDGRYFCSSSIDDSVVIFEVDKVSPLKVLNDAEHFVLGIAWHPQSLFVCGLSMDRTLRFYHPFSEATRAFCKLSTLADGSGDKLYFDDTNCIERRQLAFSPDGNYLVTTAGIYKDTACSYVYNIKNGADKITKPFLILPSLKPTGIIRFCPTLFKLKPLAPKGEKSPEPMEIACR